MPSGLQAIRDGVIEASINHEKGYVQSKEMIDIYSTREPQLAFHQRISFCLDIHNMSVKVSLQGPYWEAVGALGAPLGGAEGGDGSSSGCDGAGLSEGDSGMQPRHFWAHGFSLIPPGHEVPPQILQQGLGICRGELGTGAGAGSSAGLVLDPAPVPCLSPPFGFCFPGAPGARAAGPGVRKGNGRGRRRRLPLTPLAWLNFFICPWGRCWLRGAAPRGPPRVPALPFFYKYLHVCPRGGGRAASLGPQPLVLLSCPLPPSEGSPFPNKTFF